MNFWIAIDSDGYLVSQGMDYSNGYYVISEDGRWTYYPGVNQGAY